MDGTNIDSCALAQNNIDAALDAPIRLIAAMIPMQIFGIRGQLGRRAIFSSPLH